MRGLALFFVLVSVASADEMDDYVTATMARQKIPGLAMAVVRDGKVVRAQGYGMANVELGVPVKPETRFQSGSMGKQFTATAVMMLVEAGKVRLDDPVSKVFPDAPEAWKAITVRHLLTHTSGVATFDYGGALDVRKDYTEDELLKLAYKLPLDFPPGTQWRYSNTGYVVLGILVHKVTGKFYGDFLAERIFRPLGMDSTRIIDEADIIPDRAAGYHLVRGVLKNQSWVSPSLNTTADGSLYVTVLDLARWDAALYGERLLKKASLATMWTPVKLADGKTAPYGFGWALNDRQGHRIVEHGGAWQGFLTFITRVVDDKVTVIVLVNTANADPGLIAHHVASMVVPGLETPHPARVKVADAVLARHAGVWTTDHGHLFLLTAEAGHLVVSGLAPLDIWPASDDRFTMQDGNMVVEFAGETATSKSSGPEGHWQRIGPPPSSMAPHPDPAPGFQSAIDALASGGAALAKSTLVTDGLKASAGKGDPELADKRIFLGTVDVARLGLERFGSKVAKLTYYRFERGGSLLIYLTDSGKITDLDSLSD